MMIKRLFRLFFLPLSVTIMLFIPKSALAFTCYSNGQSVYNGAATFVVYVDPVVLDKTVDKIIISDMSKYASCKGSTGPTFKDALTGIPADISPTFAKLGYEGYFESGGEDNSFLQSTCFWPDNKCTISSTDKEITLPIDARIGLKRVAPGDWNNAEDLPAGTEIARIYGEMRGMGAWQPSWRLTWVFKLGAPVVIPRYTCQIERFDNDVTLPSIDREDLRHKGDGRIDKVTKSFRMDLSCASGTGVSVTFNGTKMPDKDDVLANTTPGNENIGIQIVSGSTPVKLGVTNEVIESSQEHESLNYNAYYYYNGKDLMDVHGGLITASTEVIFDYK
ncbi:fimbrial protein [Buttiauxella massiliensis]|uniref:fimbrial protein n=1 Tax=Buttiauxella massiliensis TaxID=2831590 RepID=UPI00125FB98D|nr:fimbrial protein [Buttiauxella massiliensis]